MADIEAIKLPNNTTYDLADATARAALSAISVTVPASNWTWDSTNNYWYNEVTVSGITSNDNYEIIGFVPVSSSTDNYVISIIVGFITYGVTSTNKIKFIITNPNIPSGIPNDVTVKLRRVI